MLKIRDEKLHMLVLFLLPVGLTAIRLFAGTIKNVEAGGSNISLSDLPFMLLILLVFIGMSHEDKECQMKGSAAVGILKYGMLLFYMEAAGFINLIRLDGGDIKDGILSLVKAFVCVGYAYIFAHFLDLYGESGRRKFTAVAAASAGMFSFTCILGVIIYKISGARVFTMYGGRASGLQTDPNLSVIFQLMSLSYVIIWGIDTGKKTAATLLAGFILIGATLCASKAGFITLVICCVWVIFLSMLARRGGTLMKLLSAIIVCAGIGYLLYNFTTYLDLYMQRLLELKSGEVTRVTTGRSIQWQAVSRLIDASPLNFVFGVGPGQFEHAAYQYGISIISYSVHNTLLSFLIEYGIVGPIMLLSPVVFLLWQLAKNSIRYKDARSLCLSWGLMGILIFMNALNFQNNRMAYVFLAYAYAYIKNNVPEKHTILSNNTQHC